MTVVYQAPPDMEKTQRDLEIANQKAQAAQAAQAAAAAQEAALIAQQARIAQEASRKAAEAKELEQKLFDERAQAEAAKKAVQQRNDPRALKAHQSRIFDNFVASIKRDVGTGPIAEINVATAGKVAVGKSNFVNAYLGDRKALTGAGRCTTKPTDFGVRTTLVGKSKIRLWDLPGHDNEFDYCDMDNIRFLSEMHVIVIIYDNTPSDVFDLIRVARALGKAIVLVRNKVDNFGDEEKDWLSELRRDEKMLVDNTTELGAQNFRVFGVSCRNAYRVRKEAEKAQQDPTHQIEQHEMFQWDEMQQTIEHIADELFRKHGAAPA